jgi:hypothetical protein
VPFRFRGDAQPADAEIDRPKLTPEDEQRLAEAQRDNQASE